MDLPGSSVFLYKFKREVRRNDVRASITIVHIQKFFKMHHNTVGFKFFLGIAKRSKESFDHNTINEICIRTRTLFGALSVFCTYMILVTR